jgi:hypothetical protein
MKLHFSQHANKIPTYFVEKIWKGLKNCISPEQYFKIQAELSSDEMKKEYTIDLEVYQKVLPKIHTIRRDLNKSWIVGKPINFIINLKGNKTIYFAPVLPVVSTQKIQIRHYKNTVLVYIDNKLFFFGNKDLTPDEFENHSEMLQFSQNEGFDSIKEFCSWFDINFKGKIIHWTNLTYKTKDQS